MAFHRFTKRARSRLGLKKSAKSASLPPSVGCATVSVRFSIESNASSHEHRFVQHPRPMTRFRVQVVAGVSVGTPTGLERRPKEARL
jgi:hypothetical protein